jgi:hypothetical protein
MDLLRRVSHRRLATGFCLVLAGLACGPSAIFAAPSVAFANVSSGSASPALDSAEAAAVGERLVARWAPVFAQQQSAEHPERDRPLRVDFDGDWNATNDWQHLDGGVRHAEAVAYDSVILTATHAFITYTLFYPRDWVEVVCVPYACHDNDLEVALVVVERGLAEADGALVLVETKTHHDYLATRGAEVALDAHGHPLIAVESGGHGMHVVQHGRALEAGSHVFVPPEANAGARSASEAGESYRLLSLHETLWERRAPTGSKGLWTREQQEWLWYTGARQGRRGRALGALMVGEVYPGGVRPPWALQAAGQRGDWFLDPAFAVRERHGAWFAAAVPPGQSYVLNRYLDDLTQECTGPRCSAAPAAPLKLGASPVALALFLGLSYVSSRRSRPRVA